MKFSDERKKGYETFLLKFGGYNICYKIYNTSNKLYVYYMNEYFEYVTISNKLSLYFRCYNMMN